MDVQRSNAEAQAAMNEVRADMAAMQEAQTNAAAAAARFSAFSTFFSAAVSAGKFFARG